MASLQQVADGLRSLNKRNKELINTINEITGNTDETIFKGVDTFVEVLENKEPVLQDKTVTENGEIVADDGYDGLGTVTVNVVEDLSNISNLLGNDIEDTKSDIESSVSDLINLANTTTGNTDTNLTDGVNALVSGFGQGGSGGISVLFKTDTVKAIGSLKRSGNSTMNIYMNEPIFTCTLVTAEAATT